MWLRTGGVWNCASGKRAVALGRSGCGRGAARGRASTQHVATLGCHVGLRRGAIRGRGGAQPAAALKSGVGLRCGAAMRLCRGRNVGLRRGAACGCARALRGSGPGGSGEVPMVAGRGCAWAQHVAEPGAQNGAALGRSMRPRWSALGRGLGPCWGAGAAGGTPCGAAQGCSTRLHMGAASGCPGA